MADFAVSKAGIRLEMWPKSQEKLIMFEHMICFKPSWLSGSMEINKLFPPAGLDLIFLTDQSCTVGSSMFIHTNAGELLEFIWPI